MGDPFTVVPKRRASHEPQPKPARRKTAREATDEAEEAYQVWRRHMVAELWR